MRNNIESDIKNTVESMISKDIIINQEGFINERFMINNLKYTLKNDTLELKSLDDETSVEINLNQVYNFEKNGEFVTFYVDNDLKLRICIKK